ncbi:alkaline phosphatase family protein [Novosphingobium sp.]|uniref:alkaline phosphatase family protein n=1 Tax=Novosphingobium sp. TaxID=1874826 RepID=UPI00286A0C0A|nr:alkaline phosphatase family protein [Novosphingobium sp.]
MRRPFVPLALFAAAAIGAISVQSLAKPAPAPKGPPRLVLAISVDQFSADLYAEYRSTFRYGLARLGQGAVFPSGYQSHAATETCPGHSTQLTGVHPARSGIIANTWFEPDGPRGAKPIYCAEDERDPASSPKDPVVSAWHLKVPTLGEYMKAANPASRNVAVSAKDRAVMMMGGHNIDAAYWWKGAGFVTLKGRTPSPAAVRQNAGITKVLAKGAKPYALPAWCKPNNLAVSVGKSTVGTGAFALEKNKPDQFRISPRMDAATVDLANALVDEMDLGRGAAPDMLSVSLSATDYIGHATGTEGAEVCIQMAALDYSIGRLLDHLDKRKIDYVVVLTADHGGLDTPERADQQAFPAAVRVDASLSPKVLSAAVAAKTGLNAGDASLVFGEGGDLFVNRVLRPAERARVVDALVQIIRANPQVAAVYTSAELAATPMPSGNPQDWTLKERARASWDPVRSGDLVFMLARGITPIPEPMVGAYVATHGSPWDYDRRVPMLFWRPGITRFEQPQPVETVDIAPTLAAILGLSIPDGSFDGRCLDLDGGAGNTCAN